MDMNVIHQVTGPAVTLHDASGDEFGRIKLSETSVINLVIGLLQDGGRPVWDHPKVRALAAGIMEHHEREIAAGNPMERWTEFVIQSRYTLHDDSKSDWTDIPAGAGTRESETVRIASLRDRYTGRTMADEEFRLVERTCVVVDQYVEPAEDGAAS